MSSHIERTKALRTIWRRLLTVLLLLLILLIPIITFAGKAAVILLIFCLGNIGGYVGIHTRLKTLTNAEVIELAKSWLAIAVPSIVGGILALVLYLIFISGILTGGLFPVIVSDININHDDFQMVFSQHANAPSEYAKLFFWSFVAGYSERYVTRLIDSIQSK
jgi:hypothetical protein